MTVQATIIEPGPGGTCRVCEATLPDGSLRCGVCGATYGEANRCPHCRAVADVDTSARPSRCRVCGGPRIVIDDSVTVRSGRDIPLLLRHVRARRAATGLRVAALAALGVAGLLLVSLAVLVAVAAPGLVLSSAGALLSVLSLVLAGLLARRARAESQDAERSLSEAELVAAADVLSSHGGQLDARRLSQALRIGEHEAEVLLAELSLSDYHGAHVTTQGALTVTPARARVATGWGGETAVLLDGETQEAPIELPPANAPLPGRSRG